METYIEQTIFTLELGGATLWTWGLLIFLLPASFLIVFLALKIIYNSAGILRKRVSLNGYDPLFAEVKTPLGFFLSFSLYALTTSPLRLPELPRFFIDHINTTLLIASGSWVCIRFIRTLARVLEEKADSPSTTDKGRMRGVRTLVTVIERIILTLIIFLTVALVLVQFEVVRTLGVSLLASAGFAGVVVGLAAQKPISSLLAGIQLAITQPIRVGDAVVVEGEWGWIEKIKLTYVVVRVWDLRRLIIPMTYFLEHPFQNWTRASSEITGTVFVHVDYTTPVARVREIFQSICRENKKWDGRVCVLQVTDTSDKTITLRGLVSAQDSPTLWDVRCEVREAFISALQDLEGGKYLPRHRVDTQNS